MNRSVSLSILLSTMYHFKSLVLNSTLSPTLYSSASPLCQSTCVMSTFNPIKELYDLYLNKEETPRIMEIVDRGSDIEDGLVDLFMSL